MAFYVVDQIETDFLYEYEEFFLAADNKVQGGSYNYIAEMRQYTLMDKLDVLENFIANFNFGDYSDWRWYPGGYCFKFVPDEKPPLPHIDVDVETAANIKTYTKRFLTYASPVWKPEWRGGTYFAPINHYKIKEGHPIAKVTTKKFRNEASLVRNVPGRTVIFDPDEIHQPEDFSGNDVQRIVFGGLLVHPDHYQAMLDAKFFYPDNGGNSVLKLALD